MLRGEFDSQASNKFFVTIEQKKTMTSLFTGRKITDRKFFYCSTTQREKKTKKNFVSMKSNEDATSRIRSLPECPWRRKGRREKIRGSVNCHA